MMDEINNKTINGQPITQELLGKLSARCEEDWSADKVSVVPTSHALALDALRALELPIEEIEALERRAQHEHRPLSVYIKSILRNELAS